MLTREYIHKRLCAHEGGFTLIEVIVVIGILGVVFGYTVPIGIEAYSAYQFTAERNTVLSLLREARNLSMSHVAESDHGVHFASSSYVLFEGPGYAMRDTSQDRIYDRAQTINVSLGGAQTEVVFQALSGNSASTSIDISNIMRAFTIHVNKQGQIDWQ